MTASERGTARTSALILIGLLLGALGLAVFITRALVPLVLPAPPDRSHQQAQRSSAPIAAAPLVPLPNSPIDPTPAALGSPADDAGAASKVQTPAEPPPRSARGRGGARPARDNDVVRVRPGSYRVKRAAAEEQLSKGGLGATKAVPVTKNGQQVGYKLYNVSPQLRRIGLRSGDVVTSINGRPLTTPDAALATYGALRKARRANIRLIRGGRPVSLSYELE